MIRNYSIEDAAALLEIYRPHIEDSAVSFELKVPSLDEFRERLNIISEKFPLLILEKENQIRGFAYANTYRSREAYQWSVESSIYMIDDAKGTGESTLLYSELLKELKTRAFQKVYAVITLPNKASILFHKKHGFKEISTFERAGFKFGQWHSIYWMELDLNDSLPKASPLFGKKG